MNTNPINKLEVLIKIRNLSKGLQTKWQLLDDAKQMTESMLMEAQTVIKLHGSELGKDHFEKDLSMLREQIIKVEELLQKFKSYIENPSSDGSEASFDLFEREIDATFSIFNKISTYPAQYFTDITLVDWANIWSVIQSNIYAVQGIAQSANIQLQMLKKFSAEEVDELTKTIFKFIPASFNMNSAIDYKNEYIQALHQMEEEANKKDNLWDRFLNFLAGNIPFKQSPQERVMMMRWIEGERGEL
jgi:hypothetical protein